MATNGAWVRNSSDLRGAGILSWYYHMCIINTIPIMFYYYYYYLYYRLGHQNHKRPHPSQPQTVLPSALRPRVSICMQQNIQVLQKLLPHCNKTHEAWFNNEFIKGLLKMWPNQRNHVSELPSNREQERTLALPVHCFSLLFFSFSVCLAYWFNWENRLQ